MGVNRICDNKTSFVLHVIYRRERGVCRICWTQQADTDFQLSGSQANNGKYKQNVTPFFSWFVSMT